MASYERCIVCGTEVREPKHYGNRAYCEVHFEEFPEDIPSLWRASVLTFTLLLVMVAGLAVLNQFAGSVQNELLRIIVSVSTVLLPAMIWMSVLYRSATGSHVSIPTFVPVLFAGAALVAAAATRPLLFELIGFDDWLWQTTPVNRFAGTVLVAGILHCFMLYGTLRFTVWQTPAFSRRAHGILYGLAGGMGYGSALNLLFVLDEGSLSTLNGGLYLVTHLCAYLTPALIIGYYLGRTRFEEMPFYYPPLGQLLAAGLTGLLLYAGTELNSIRLGADQDGFSPWPGLAVNLIALSSAYGAVFGLLRRHNTLTKARMEQAQ